MADNTRTYVILGAAAIALYYLYENGYLYEWTGLTELYPGTLPTTSAAPVTTTATTPSTPTAPPTPPPVVTLAGPVTASPSHAGALRANISINGAVEDLGCIPGGQCYDETSGHGVTLPSGVTAAQIYALMQASYVPASSSQSSSGSSSGNTLTAADAAFTPYSSSITTDDIDSISATLDSQLAAGAIPLISPDSVLAYMLGWGDKAKGTTETTSGYTYTFDGSNWVLKGKALSGLGLGYYRVPTSAIHGGPSVPRLNRGLFQ